MEVLVNMRINNLHSIILVVLITFVLSTLIMPLIIRIAKHIGAIDIPKDDRRVHNHPIPRLGGLGIFISFLIGYMFFGVHSIKMNSILIGSFIIIITGIIDDIKPLKSIHKLIGQSFAAFVIIFYGNILLSKVSIFGIYLNFNVWSYLISYLFIIGCINIINLIDGLDGLSGGITTIFMLTIGIISFFQGRFGSLEMSLTFIMLGSVLGFLYHNFYPAKIFAGDTGSMFMGFIISVISLLGFKGTMFTSLLVPLLILTIPIIDTFLAIVRRFLKKKPIYEGDKEHIHHQFLKMNFSQRTTVLIIYVINILFSIASVIFILLDEKIGIIIYVILFSLVVIFTLHTSILSERIRDKIFEFERNGISIIKKKNKRTE